MAKLPTDTSRRPPAKRVISESSSEDDTPIAKRPKSDSNPTPVLRPTPTSQPRRDAPTSSAPSTPDHADDGSDQAKGEEEDGALVDSSDDDAPIANSNYKPSLAPKRSIDESSASTTLTTNTDPPSLENKKLPKIKKYPQAQADSSSDDDQPLVSRSTGSGNPCVTSSIRRTSAEEADESDSDDSQPLIQSTTSKLKPAKNSKASKKAAKQPADPEPPRPKGKQTRKTKKELKAEAEAAAIQPAEPEPSQAISKQKPKNKKELKAEEEAAAEAAMYKWWEESKDDTSKKWTTLEHNGVLFPPDYEPLPGHVKIKYDGKSVDLPPEAEEVAYFFGSMLNSDHVQKPTFCRNFFEDWLEVLKQHPPRDGTKITEFSKCDFTPIGDYVDAEREAKKSMTKEKKLQIRAEKEAQEKNYRFCILDGRVEKVGNFRVEPPSLFRGRGDHPKTGKLKKRINAEDIHINCSAESKFPEPPAGHRWAEIVHIPTASWLAWWKENINGHTKYVFLAAGSSLTGQSDLRKFEKARKLKDHIDRIRADYRAKLTDRVMAVRQRATAMYLIDRFALRAGNEKSAEEEADTVGCCSLRLEHVTLEPPCTVTFDFLGKDSIRFFNKFEVDPAVFRNLMIFKKNKAPSDMIFDRLSTTSLNKHLSDYMEGLTAKVFRTYNASITFEQELEKNMKNLPAGSKTTDKMLAYTKANRQVAVLCNHQKAVSKTHGVSMDKCRDKILASKYKRRLARLELLAGAPDLDPKTRALCLIDESDLDEESMERHEKLTQEKKRESLIRRYKSAEQVETSPTKEDKAQEKQTQAPEKQDKVAKKSEHAAEKPENAAEKPEEGPKKPKKPKEISFTEKWASMTPAEREVFKANEFASCEREAEEMKVKREQLSTGIKSEPLSKQAITKMTTALNSANAAIHKDTALLKDRDEGKETSLGTSKTNYIDPRLSFAWCKKYNIATEKVFPKTLKEKFTWASATEADWKF